MTERHKCIAKKNITGTDAPRCVRIRCLNDAFRTTLIGGRVMITSGVSNLGLPAVSAIVGRVKAFAAFEPGDDPYQEHDFGCVVAGAERVFWKIHYYDRDLAYGSPDPADPSVTARVLTIMLASEY